MKKRRVPLDAPPTKLELISDDDVPTHSRCCKKEITGRRMPTKDPLVSVLVGLCSKCRKPVARRNPRTEKHEWLNGHDYATLEDAKP